MSIRYDQLDHAELLFVSRYGPEAYMVLREKSAAVISEALLRIAEIGDPVDVNAQVAYANEVRTKLIRKLRERRQRNT